MAGNSFGTLFRITTFGESHGKAIGVVIDGCPAGLEIDEDFIRKDMARRKPGQSAISSPRKEEDEVEIISGVFQNRSTGAPITLLIQNKDQRSADYERFKDIYRPSHADFTYDEKYGFRDYRGGGRSSARETAARVAAGAIAKLLLQNSGIRIQAFVSQVGKVKLEVPYTELDLSQTETNLIRCPHIATAEKMLQAIEEARDAGDSLGGIITCVIQNSPTGLGEPVFDKLHADLGKAMLSINAVKGFDIGSGFDAASMRGSEHNDEFISTAENQIHTKTNNSGGIQGGISNGEDIYFRVAFKPVATIAQKQQTVNQQGEKTEVEGKGRHDPCV
ncbi:MAG: chorismate synthase, partial [Bacteroidia bacterium]